MQAQLERETRQKEDNGIKQPRKFYFDTSIWLDFLEKRDEPNFPKSQWVKALVNKIIDDEDRILLSNANYRELERVGYSRYDIKELLMPIRKIIILVRITDKQIGKAQDLALKRNIPNKDALHALIARDNHAIFITFDYHFQELKDIIKPHTPKEFL